MSPSTNTSQKTMPIETNDVARIKELALAVRATKASIANRIVGQQEVIDHLLIALFAGGHALFVGVPGLAKTLLIQTLSETLDLSFNRIQFTPDLMPSDVTGTDILDQGSDGRRAFRFVKGPIFTNLLLADEINRTPPKTQAALLQAMQEHQVTASGQTHTMPTPFHVFATQNPIEQEGTYPLPEAQMDRFMFMLNVSYPTEDEEVQIVRTTTQANQGPLPKVLSPEQIIEIQALVRRVPVPNNVTQHAVQLVRSTRPDSAADHISGPTLDKIREYVSFGAGPRASQYLVLGAKTRAAMEGRPSATINDVRAIAVPVLAHRVVTNFHAEAEGIRPSDLVQEILDTIRG